MLLPQQIRAARAWLNLGQQEVAQEIDVSAQTISDIENERTNPKASIVDRLQSFFEIRGLEFLPDGGIKKANNFVKIYEGDDCYLKLLDDAHKTLREGEEFLKSAADEKRSTKEVIQKTRSMRRDGIKMRALIKNEDTYLLGPLSEYRWMDDTLFTNGDVKIIYGNRVGYLVSWLSTKKIILIEDKHIADEARRHFNYVWEQSLAPDRTTATDSYEETSND